MCVNTIVLVNDSSKIFLCYAFQGRIRFALNRYFWRMTVKRSSWALLVALTPLAAQAAPVASFDISTLGPGFAIGVPISRYLGLRVGINHYTKSRTGVYTSGGNSIGYAGNVRLRSASFLADYAPFAGVFHLSAGMIKDDNGISAVGVPTNGGYVINGQFYPAAYVGNLSANLTMKPWAPYLGLGWGHNPAGDSGLRFGVDLGVMFQGTPRVQLAASNPTGDPNVTNNVAAAQATAQQSANKYTHYPVIGASIGYSF